MVLHCPAATLLLRYTDRVLSEAVEKLNIPLRSMTSLTHPLDYYCYNVKDYLPSLFSLNILLVLKNLLMCKNSKLYFF